MKTLNKLNINPEKAMKEQELIKLKGGTLGYMYQCICEEGANPPWASTWWACYTALEDMQNDYSRCINGWASCWPEFMCNGY